jgi:hypothetical protein
MQQREVRVYLLDALAAAEQSSRSATKSARTAFARTESCALQSSGT